MSPPGKPKRRWLPTLEQELKSRVGWVDEAVSPFAVERRAVQAAAKIQRDAVMASHVLAYNLTRVMNIIASSRS